MTYPERVLHYIDGDRESGEHFVKYNPATDTQLALVARGNFGVAREAVSRAHDAFPQWSEMSIVQRGNILRKAAALLEKNKETIAKDIALELGKSPKEAMSEVNGAIEHAYFWAGEGRRSYGRTTSTSVPNRMAMTIRSPVGVCVVISPANTPFGARAVFPALLCGNTVVMKPSEDAPYAPIILARILQEAGLPAGVFSVVHGLGAEVGEPLVTDQRVSLVSFTGSVKTGKKIQKIAAAPKVSLELGGKNAMVICDDVDMKVAVESAVLSAFSNAGQRCAAASRIIVFNSVYHRFLSPFLKRTMELKLGIEDGDDLGPVINQTKLHELIHGVAKAQIRHANVLTGGNRVPDERGYYMQPTVLENISPDDPISRQELFGPVTCIYRVENIREAIALANQSEYGLTAAIHTQNLHYAKMFWGQVRAGAIHVNHHTYGSEPHMPFGGFGDSGNGWREAGTEALDFYSELKSVTIRHFPQE